MISLRPLRCHRDSLALRVSQERRQAGRPSRARRQVARQGRTCRQGAGSDRRHRRHDRRDADDLGKVNGTATFTQQTNDVSDCAAWAAKRDDFTMPRDDGAKMANGQTAFLEDNPGHYHGPGMYAAANLDQNAATLSINGSDEPFQPGKDSTRTLTVNADAERHWGRVVHLSTLSTTTFNGYSAYVSAKLALNGYVKTMSREVAKDNVIVYGHHAGTIYSEGRFFAKLTRENPAALDQYFDNHLPTRRLGTGEDVAAVTAFLCPSTPNSWLERLSASMAEECKREDFAHRSRGLRGRGLFEYLSRQHQVLGWDKQEDMFTLDAAVLAREDIQILINLSVMDSRGSTIFELDTPAIR